MRTPSSTAEAPRRVIGETIIPGTRYTFGKCYVSVGVKARLDSVREFLQRADETVPSDVKCLFEAIEEALGVAHEVAVAHEEASGQYAAHP
jgi:hypothetical protein